MGPVINIKEQNGTILETIYRTQSTLVPRLGDTLNLVKDGHTFLCHVINVVISYPNTCCIDVVVRLI